MGRGTNPTDPACTKITPPELARRWGITPEKVLTWIGSGELRAINVALTTRGRPRWLIDLADIAAFEKRRAAVPEPVHRQRRRPPMEVTEYIK